MMLYLHEHIFSTDQNKHGGEIIMSNENIRFHGAIKRYQQFWLK